ncbi:general secretion pathway protein I [Rhodopseudomonas rhenobacensis]|uniref:General secretion pathway protein I n=1 Tax=Rhodopseudomonas rhenobacensis TaxID=87461 RepID=A0A7W7Z5T7_9BRAD|nr:prepilin-type N-terminal cleavage/methylation domain-containing protein [Rhodopseudomonas rhenobacensis]MBB5048564.1 general secretion pathway protein I [Rhodopseudomonas rhenobacensis]
MFRNGRSDPQRGFTLIEVLIALAILAWVLAAIAPVIATTVRGSRNIQDRLAISGIAETLLSGLNDRGSLKVGRTIGESGGHRWSVDVAPLPDRGADNRSNWTPCAVTIQVRAAGGSAIRLTTVVLIARSTG